MLHDAGYYMTNRLTNAIEFGAPQDRDRILLFGMSKSLFPNSNNNPLDAFPWENTLLIHYQKSRQYNGLQLRLLKKTALLNAP